MSRRRILLVDDDRDIALGAGIRLRASGYEVTTANDGEEGFACAIADPPDAIVLDIRMPKRDGLTMLADLKRDGRTREIPVIVLSANGIDENRTRAAELGARFFLGKPYEPKRLIEVLETTLNGTAG